MSQRKMHGYFIFHTLGKGGFSKVKLGIHETTKERVGLKLLKKDRVSGNIRKQVERELTAMAKIQHENVIRLKEVEWNALYPKKNGTKVEVILVVLELATGGELFEYLSFTGLFEENIARTYFRQLIDGVSYCHSKGIAHRDLKPENVLYDEHFVLKIADFGFSNAFEDTDKTMYTECGTPGYMAPEMFKRSGYDAPACDVWACGVILFIMLASFPPFQRPAMTDWWFNKLQTMRYQLFWEAHCRSAYFSEAAKDLINKMLCVDPAKRITMEQIKKHTFFQGPVVSASALYAEFTRRKTIVDEKKFRERSTADRDMAEKFAANNEDDMLTEGTVRGENDTIINAESDSIPAAPPARLAVDLYLVKDDQHDSNASFGDDNTTFSADDSEPYEEDGDANNSSASASSSSSSSSSSTSSSSEVKAPLLDGAFLTSFGFSHFTAASAHSVSSILSRLDQILTSKKIDHTVKISSAKIKGRIILKDGTLEFAIQIYQNAKDSTHQVVFTRVTGDGQDFFRLFAGVRAQATDIISIPEAAPAHIAVSTSSTSSSSNITSV